MKALVLCAGRGTRLGALTATTPKALLPVAGEPLLGRLLRWLAREGIADIAVNIHHGADLFEPAIGNGRRYGVSIRWVREVAPRGTAGTVRALDPWFGPADALVVYGDLLLDFELAPMAAFHRAQRADATLLVHRGRSNSALDMAPDGRIRSFLERPAPDGDRPTSWVNSGVQILSRAARAWIPDAPASDLPADVYQHHVVDRIFGFPLAGRRLAIDSPERYERAQVWASMRSLS